MSTVEPTSIDTLLAMAPWCRRDVLTSILSLAQEIAREGHEGRSVGALFTLGSVEPVLERSRPLILDPLQGHSAPARHISDARLRGTIKQLAQLDGAFVVAEDGTVAAACRYLDAPADDVHVPLGLGSRHVAAASISKRLPVVAIALSQSGVVRVYHHGDLTVEFTARAT